MNKKILNFKKETLEASTNLGIEQIKETNPNLYAHVKRAFKVEQKNIKLKEEQLKLKEERKQLRLEYFKITQAFAAEEKLKQKLKETEILVEAKEKNVNELTSKLSDFQEKNYVMKQNIQNVEVKKLFFNYNEICAKKEHLRNIKIELAKEIEQVQEILLKTSKHPEKITPTAANTNLRKEIRMLEMEVMEASKRIKELEQDHLQAQFAYEESKRTLRDLMKPVITPIYIPRTSLSRRSTLKDGMSPVSPGKKSVTIADYPHSAIIYEVGASIKAESPTSTKRASILKSIQPESPGSPQKRASILQILGKGMTETLTEQLSKALKGVGKPGSSISAKLLAMNRGALIGK